MSYYEDEGGKLNNFAVEPKVYQEAPKSANDQKKRFIIGAVGALLVVALIAVTFLISGAA